MQEKVEEDEYESYEDDVVDDVEPTRMAQQRAASMDNGNNQARHNEANEGPKALT